MLPRWCSTTVTVTRPAMVERRGTTVPDWTNATSATVSGCQLTRPSTSTQPDGTQRDPTTSTWTLLCPAGADVRRGDRVTVDGRTYDVQGVPTERTSPTGLVSHLAVALTERTG